MYNYACFYKPPMKNFMRNDNLTRIQILVFGVVGSKQIVKWPRRFNGDGEFYEIHVVGGDRWEATVRQ